MTPLLLAASTGQSDLVEFLVSAGADASIKNSAGKNILELAKYTTRKMLEWLIVNATQPDGRTPLRMTHVHKKPASSQRKAETSHSNWSKKSRRGVRILSLIHI